jgi:mRNA-degrading endonuclease RelE of RelBE toxin-antitoxin system
LPKLRLKRPAKEQLVALPRQIQEELDFALLRLQAHPTEVGRRLGPSLPGLWRMRVSGYRVLYRLREGGNLVIVESIRPRNPRTYPGRR